MTDSSPNVVIVRHEGVERKCVFFRGLSPSEAKYFLQGAFGVEDYDVMGLFDKATRTFFDVEHICRNPESLPSVTTLVLRPDEDYKDDDSEVHYDHYDGDQYGEDDDQYGEYYDDFGPQDDDDYEEDLWGLTVSVLFGKITRDVYVEDGMRPEDLRRAVGDAFPGLPLELVVGLRGLVAPDVFGKRRLPFTSSPCIKSHFPGKHSRPRSNPQVMFCRSRNSVGTRRRSWSRP